jgi:hypothetical protein
VGQETKAPGSADLRGRLIAVMEELEIEAPDRMASRIERMLDDKDRERVLRQLLDDFRTQSTEEMRRILKVLAPGRDEWAREVDRLLANYRPMK